MFTKVANHLRDFYFNTRIGFLRLFSEFAEMEEEFWLQNADVGDLTLEVLVLEVEIESLKTKLSRKPKGKKV